MPVERQRWSPSATMGQANSQLKRTVEVFDTADRYQVQRLSATATLALGWPLTLVVVTTSGGNVTVTLPSAQTVPGFRIEVKKLTAANTLTVAAASIDGAATLAWSTQYQSYSLISDGSVYHVV